MGPRRLGALRTVVRVETETCDATGTLLRRDERYLVSSLPRCRLTPEHGLLVLRRHSGVETAHQVLDRADSGTEPDRTLRQPGPLPLA